MNNILHLTYKEHEEDIIDAFAEVYGIEYRDIISSRIKKVDLISYATDKSVNTYLNFLFTCKRRELALKFLSQIGIDISNNSSSFADDFDPEIKKLVNMYLGDIESIDFENHLAGIFAFRGNSTTEKIKEQIEFLRNLGIDVTLDTYDEFMGTPKYEEVMKQINEYVALVDDLVNEYFEYSNSFREYQDYISIDKNHKMQIKKYLYDRIINYLKERHPNINPRILGTIDMTEIFDKKCLIEYFSSKDEELLERGNGVDRTVIYCGRINYFNALGIKVSDCQSLEEEYRKVMASKEVQELIPSEELIVSLRDALNWANDEYLSMRLKLGDKPKENYSYKMLRRIAYNQNDYQICNLIDIDNLGKENILLFTTLDFICGYLDFALCHELTHTVETIVKNDKIFCGFEEMTHCICNPYRPQKRLHERWDETITDIIAEKVMHILHQKGIYLFEDSSHTVNKTHDGNTSMFLKQIITPFYEKFHPLIVHARLYGDTDNLKNAIGAEDFEKINSLVNYFDYLQATGQDKLINTQRGGNITYEFSQKFTELQALYEKLGLREPVNLRV